MQGKSKVVKSLARLKKLNRDATTAELQALRDLQEELSRTGRLGDLPRQTLFAKKAIAYCLKVMDTADAKCSCPVYEDGDKRLPPRWLCPACQRARSILRVFIQVESLTVRRAAVEERFFNDLLRARLSLGDSGEGESPVNFAELVRQYRSMAAPARSEPGIVDTVVDVDSVEPVEATSE